MVSTTPAPSTPSTQLNSRVREFFTATPRDSTQNSSSVTSDATSGLPTQTSSPSATLPTVPVSNQDKLAIFEEVIQSVQSQSSTAATQSVNTRIENFLQEVKQHSAQPSTAATTQTTDPAFFTPTAAKSVLVSPSVAEPAAQAPVPSPQGSSRKEAALASSTESTPDTAGGVWVLEQDQHPEIPVEVESFVEKVVEDQQIPQEIAVAGNDISIMPSQLPAKPVIVLPITQEMEEAGEKKSAKYSLRWLVEWSRKLMKMFSGEVVYKQTSG